MRNESSYVERLIRLKSGAENAAQLREYQLRMLDEVVSYARENSRYYADSLKHVAGHVADVSALPFTCAADIASHWRDMVCTAQKDIARIVTMRTSGTTGPPKRLCFSAAEQEATVDFFRYGMRELADPGDAVLILLPCETEGSVGKLLAAGIERIPARPLLYGIPTDYTALIAFLRQTAVQVIVGIPQQLLKLSRLLALEGGVPSLKSVLVGTDYSSPGMMRTIGQNLHCRVHDNYGMTELCYGGGVEPRQGRGYHMRHHDFLFEIVDPQSGAPVPFGGWGEVVFTTLTRRCMPLIRYRTGDISRFISGIYPALDKIRGRRDSVSTFADGGVLNLSDIDDALFALEDVLDFRAEIRGDALVLHVESVDFNSQRLRGALLRSPAGEALAGRAVEIFPAVGFTPDPKGFTKRTIATLP